MAKAITIMRWYLGESVRLQQAGRMNPSLILADEVLKFFKPMDRGTCRSGTC